MSFVNSLNKGDLGEMLYLEAHSGTIKKLDGRKSDFINIETNERIEMKTDFYSMKATPNFFIEHYSDKDKRTLGGPWRAQTDGSNLFVYMYVKDLTIFTFDVDQLVGRLDEIIQTIEPTNVRNADYTTQGYRVPRSLLEGMASVKKLKVVLE